jgi:hypothetical protein
LKKRTKKLSFPGAAAKPPGEAKMDESLFASFSSEKEDSSFPS